MEEDAAAAADEVAAGVALPPPPELPATDGKRGFGGAGAVGADVDTAPACMGFGP